MNIILVSIFLTLSTVSTAAPLDPIELETYMRERYCRAKYKMCFDWGEKGCVRSTRKLVKDTVNPVLDQKVIPENLSSLERQAWLDHLIPIVNVGVAVKLLQTNNNCVDLAQSISKQAKGMTKSYAQAGLIDLKVLCKAFKDLAAQKGLTPLPQIVSTLKRSKVNMRSPGGVAAIEKFLATAAQMKSAAQQKNLDASQSATLLLTKALENLDYGRLRCRHMAKVFNKIAPIARDPYLEYGQCVDKRSRTRITHRLIQRCSRKIPEAFRFKVGLDPDLVPYTISLYVEDMSDCYDRLLKKRKDAQGKIVVAWEITTKGRVKNPTIESDTVKSKRFRKCLLSQVRKMSFPKPGGEDSIPVTFPFSFQKSKSQK